MGSGLGACAEHITGSKVDATPKYLTVRVHVYSKKAMCGAAHLAQLLKQLVLRHQRYLPPVLSGAGGGAHRVSNMRVFLKIC